MSKYYLKEPQQVSQQVQEQGKTKKYCLKIVHHILIIYLKETTL